MTVDRFPEPGALAAAVLDALALGVFVTDADGVVLVANAAAHAVLSAAAGLTVDRGRLAALTSGATERLRDAIRAAASADAPGSATLVDLDRPTGVPYALVAPLRPSVGTAASLVLLPPSAPDDLAVAAVLREAHGFTAAEVRVARALTDRRADVATRLGLSPNTVATHVKRMFAKTGARNRSGLVALLLSGPAALQALVARTGGPFAARTTSHDDDGQPRP